MALPTSLDSLLIAGERLFAERGPEAPLREIAIAAGHRNNSAVHYHFGDRGGLVEAIVRRRLEGVEHYGQDALIDVDQDDPHQLIDVLVRSLIHAPAEQGATHYARFLEVMRNQIKSWPADPQSSWSIITERLIELAPGRSTRERRKRVSAMTTAMFALLADRERGLTHSSEPEQIVDMLAGLHGATS